MPLEITFDYLMLLKDKKGKKSQNATEDCSGAGMLNP